MKDSCARTANAASYALTRPARQTGMRVALVVDSLAVGGAERHVTDLALALDRAGHSVTIVCSTSGVLAAHLDGSSVRIAPVLEVAVKRRTSARYARTIWNLVRSERPDLVHAHLYASATAAALATFADGPPLVLTEHSEGHWQREPQRRMAAWSSRRAAHIIAVSAAIRARLVDRLGVPESRVSLIHNAVPPPRGDGFSALPVPSAGGPVVGVVARLVPEKGIHVFLDAMARVRERLPHVRAIVVGDGELRAALTRRVAALGLGPCVSLVGEVPDARPLIGSLDLLVVPSLTEGEPLVVLEALASGVPVVASRVGGIPAQLEHARGCVLVAPGDAGALARALVTVLSESSLPRAGVQRPDLTPDGGSYAAMLQRTLTVYDRVTVGARLPVVSVRHGQPSEETA